MPASRWMQATAIMAVLSLCATSGLADEDEPQVNLRESVLADAETRPVDSLGAPIAGWDGAPFISSGDGRFRLELHAFVQTRWVYGGQEDSGGDDHSYGFEISRTRIGFKGSFLDPSFTYFVWPGWNASGASFVLDAYVDKRIGDGWHVTAGQFKIPTWREWLVSETRQQLIERSLLNARYGPDYGQGVMLRHQGETMAFVVAYTDGMRTRNTDWDTAPSETTGAIPYPKSNEYAFSARAEKRWGGEWSCGSDFEGWIGQEPSFILGVAGHIQQSDSGTPDPETEIIQWTVDGALEMSGVNVFGAVIGMHVDDDEGVRRDEYGVLFQAGWFPNEDWELFARYEWGDLDGAGAVSNDLSIATIGFSRFWSRHGWKWTTDVGYGFEAVDAAWAGAGAGWRPDAAGEDGQVVIRTQLQVGF